MTKEQLPEIEAGEMVSDIVGEVLNACWHGNIDNVDIDMKAIKRMVESDPDGWDHLTELMHRIVDRYVGNKIAEDEEGSNPLPKRSTKSGEQ